MRNLKEESPFRTDRQQILQKLKDNKIIAQVRGNSIDVKKQTDIKKVRELFPVDEFPQIKITYGFYE